MHIIGIHLDFPFIHIAHIYKRRRGIEVQSLKKFDLSDQDTQNHEAIVKQLYNSNFKGRVASGLSANHFLTRTIELKVNSMKHVKEAISFQSEATNHLNPEEILTVPLFQKKTKGLVKALVFTVPREHLKEHLLQLEALQIDPDGVSIIPLSICHFMQWKFPALKEALIVHLGSEETSCILMEEGQLKKTHAIPIGIEMLLDSLLKDRKKILLKRDIEGTAKQIDLLLLKPGLNPNLASQLKDLKQEIAKTASSFHRGSEKKPIIFTGRLDAFIHLKEFLSNEPENEWTLTLEEQQFMPSIGLALEHVSSNPLQLLQEEFFPRKNWGKMGIYALSLLILSTLLSAIILILGSLHFQSRKLEILHSLPTSHGDKLNNTNFIEERIEQWISSVTKNNKEYPYILQAPKASQVLSWLSDHPLLNELKKEGDPIDIQEVRYQLIKFPKIGSLKEPYQSKVEIEFQFKNHLNARKFHEALMKGDAYVDSSLEITWETLNDSYRTSFFLNNRGSHV